MQETTTVQTSNRSAVWQYIFLLLITVLAALLRFYKLGEWSFWGDELSTLKDASNAINGDILTPTSFFAIGAVLKIFGISEWSARLVPALLGTISIPIFYFPLKRVTNRSTALISVLLLAVSPWHLYWSQNARFYTPLLLFYTLSLLTFYLAIEEDRPVFLILSLLFAGLAVKERLFAFMLIPIMVGYLGLLLVLPYKKPPGLRIRTIAILLLPGLLALPLFGWKFIQEPARWFDSFGWINNNPFWLLAGVVYYIGIPTICIGGLGGLYLLLKKDRAALLLLLGAVVPLAAVMVISLFQYTANRYLFITLTSWLILAALGAKELFWHMQGNAKVLAIGALATLLLSPLSENLLYYQYQNGNRDNWKGALAYVEQQKGPDDVVIVPNQLLGEYYLDKSIIAMSKLDLSTLQGDNRVWFVEDMNVAAKWPHVLDWIHVNTIQMAQMDVHVQARTYKMRVYLYDPQNRPPTANWVISEKP